MTPFLIAAALMLAASLALLARPWWRQRRTDAESRRALNAAIYRDQLAELEIDRGSGELGDADYQEARGELQRRLLDDAAGDDTPHAGPTRAKGTLVAIVVALPLAAAGLYAWLGTPAALEQTARRDFTQADIEGMVAGLATKLKKEPENLQGWAMLARSYKAMRRYDEAERAFERALTIVEKDPQLLADYADLLASKAGDLGGRPEQLIAKALALDPDHLQSLWLAGSAAFNRKDYGRASEHWQRALKQLPPESEDAQMLNNIIAEAKQKMGATASEGNKKNPRPRRGAAGGGE